MRQYFLTILFVFCFCSLSLAQNRFFGGFDVSIDKNNVTSIQSNYDVEFRSVTARSIGFFIGKQLNKNFKIQIGFRHKEFLYSGHYVSGNFDIKYIPLFNQEIYLIPLTIKPRISLYKEKFFLVNTLGLNFYYNNNSSVGSSSGTIYLETGDSLTVATKNIRYKGMFMLFETGIGLEYLFANGLSTSISANYSTGFKTINEWDYSHFLNEPSPIIYSKFLNKGNYMSLSFSLFYRFSFNKKN